MCPVLIVCFDWSQIQSAWIKHDPVLFTAHLTNHHSFILNDATFVTCLRVKWFINHCDGAAVLLYDGSVCTSLEKPNESLWTNLDMNKIRNAEKQNDCKQTTQSARKTFDLFLLKVILMSSWWHWIKSTWLVLTFIRWTSAELFINTTAAQRQSLTSLRHNCLTLNHFNWHFEPLTFGLVVYTGVFAHCFL